MKHAIAVQENEDLLLILKINRSPRGDIYLNFLRSGSWNPHVSMHASGQYHHKSYNNTFGIHQWQNPDSDFVGTKNLVTFGISKDEPSAINKPCISGNYTTIFKIPSDDLKTDKYKTFISIDISEANGVPIITPGATIVKKRELNDAIP